MDGQEPGPRQSARPRRLLRRIGAALGLGTGALGIAILARHNPLDLPWAPQCTFRLLTGLRCPGCGMTRALHHLLQGEIVTALAYNPLIVAVPLIVIASAWYLLAVVVRGEPPRAREPSAAVGWVLLAVLLGFWSYRLLVDILARSAG